MNQQEVLTIIKETKHWLLLNKSAGMVVEKNPYEETSVEGLVYEYLAEQYRNPYVGIVHRLDRVTSGALLIAKRKSALRRLNEQFRQQQVQKTYVAIVSNTPPQTHAYLKHYLIKNQKEKRSEIYEQPVEGGKLVALKYELLKESDDLSLLRIYPETGKFHQIRAQLAAIDCPIVGDKKYGSTYSYVDRKIALHAERLRFEYTQNGLVKIEDYRADLPDDELWSNFRSDKMARN